MYEDNKLHDILLIASFFIYYNVEIVSQLLSRTKFCLAKKLTTSIHFSPSQ